MKWLLVTNLGNPGDEFARIGVEEIIKSLDDDPKFVIVRRDPRPGVKEVPLTAPQEFDIAVVCSMPGFWSHVDKNGDHNSPLTHYSWGPYTGWLTAKKPVIMAGFGLYLTYDRFPTKVSIHKREYTVARYAQMLKRFAAVYSRSTLAKKVFGNQIECHPCPSIFAGRHMERSRDLKLCNFMPGGAHYPGLNRREADKMGAVGMNLANFLLDQDFKFMAHCDKEYDKAIALGWTEDNIFRFRHKQDAGKAGEFLKIYARASHYIGNRIHGAIVSRSFGANTLCIGYDTRLHAAEDVGALVCTPTTFNSSMFRNWLKDEGLPMNLDLLFEQQRAIFKKVIEKL